MYEVVLNASENEGIKNVALFIHQMYVLNINVFITLKKRKLQQCVTAHLQCPLVLMPEKMLVIFSI